MAASKSTTDTKMNGKKGMSSTNKNNDLFGLKINYVPLFSTNDPIEEDDTGVPIKGTGLMIYQGYFPDTYNVENERGELKVVPCTRHIFAVLALGDSWKCIEITMYGWGKNNTYDRFLKKMGLSNVMVEIDDRNKIPGFTKNIVPNNTLIDEELEKLRGMGFLAIQERIVTQKGAKIYNILIDTIKPLKSDGVHTRLQSLELTDPKRETIYSLEAE